MPSLNSIADKPTLKYFESKKNKFFFEKLIFFTKLAPQICHMTNTFMEKNFIFY